MIQRLDHTDSQTAEIIHFIFQKSYTVEATLLGAVDFPPLGRTQKSFLKSQNQFHGFYMEKELAGVIELVIETEKIHIQSLVVLPRFFRLGIASGLLSYVFVSYPCNSYSVETGVKNIPAITLYKSFGFIEIKQWDTDHGVRKARFEKKL